MRTTNGDSGYEEWWYKKEIGKEWKNKLINFEIEQQIKHKLLLKMKRELSQEISMHKEIQKQKNNERMK